jgi:flagellar protein FliO/FliZ
MYDLLASQPLAVRFFIAFVVVLILIGLTAWLVRRFTSNRIGGVAARGRQPRLAVIDAASIDGRRRLVLIRRDNVEHLLMIGGPTDVVVEPNIVRAMSAGTREQTPRGGIEPVARQASPPEAAWSVQPSNEPSPPLRPYRSPAPEEAWQMPEPSGRSRTPESLTGLAAELTSRISPGEPAPRNAPPPLAPEPAMPTQTDQNLAEMAQQLEAALRRGPQSEARPPVTDPLAFNAPGKPAETASRPAPREFKSRAEPKFDAKPEGKREQWPEQKPEPKFEAKFEPKFDQIFEPKPEPKAEPKAEPKPEPAPASGKNPYENLEDEMASLLGRPSGKA